MKKRLMILATAVILGTSLASCDLLEAVEDENKIVEKEDDNSKEI